MGPANAGIKRKRRTDGPNHPERKKKIKPVFKKMKPSAYHSSSEEDDVDEDDSAQEPAVSEPTNVAVRFPKDEVEKKKDEKGTDTVSAAVAGEAGVQSDFDDGVQLPNLEIDVGEDDEDDDEFDVQDTPSDDDDDEQQSGTLEGDQVHEQRRKQIKKRNDPAAFAASISAILSSKLTTTKRADPVLSRSAAAASNAEQRADQKLEAKAKRKLTHDKQALLDRGHVRDVLGVEGSEVSAAAVAANEKRLRKMAQRGVVKLFNAVRAAQVRGEEMRGELQRTPGETVGIDRRTEKVNQMSKQGFLDLLVQGS